MTIKYFRAREVLAMKTLIVFDSVYGNTEKVARAIGSAISGDVKVLRVNEMQGLDLVSNDLLVVGSPNHGGRPSPGIQDYIQKLPETALKGKMVVAFDTRYSSRLVRIFGYAAERIADSLKNGGGSLALPPEGFYVKGKEGPLKEGELERVISWAKKLVE